MTVPDRLFDTVVHVVLSREEAREEEMGVPARSVPARYTLDLDAVLHVRECVDFDAEPEAVLERECSVALYQGDTVTVMSPYAEVVAAWRAYRAHADRMGRLRN